MGREVRRVAIGWQHPKKECLFNGRISEEFIPLYDQDFETAMAAWLSKLADWKKGGFLKVCRRYPDRYKASEPLTAFCRWEGQAPNPEDYRPKWADDAVLGYALYENVSEGTPVTPTFATEQELIEYLVAEGIYWDDKGWGREAAEGIVRSGYAPSLVIMGGNVILPSDGAMYDNGGNNDE